VKRAAFALLFGGLVALAVGGFVGCGTLFAWNGRHEVARWSLTPGAPLSQPFDAVAERRYSAAIEVVFDRRAARRAANAAGAAGEDEEVHARMPLVASFVDDSGAPVRPVVTGWFDPELPPAVVYGRGSDAKRGGRAVTELAAERMIGPWRCPRTGRARIDVDLGADRSPPDAPAPTPVVDARVVLYDDARPSAIVAGFVLAGAGLLSFLTGGALLFFFRGPRRRRRRGDGNGAHDRERGGKRERPIV
jgi:hypothetical protein